MTRAQPTPRQANTMSMTPALSTTNPVANPSVARAVRAGRTRSSGQRATSRLPANRVTTMARASVAEGAGQPHDHSRGVERRAQVFGRPVGRGPLAKHVGQGHDTENQQSCRPPPTHGCRSIGRDGPRREVVPIFGQQPSGENAEHHGRHRAQDQELARERHAECHGRGARGGHRPVRRGSMSHGTWALRDAARRLRPRRLACSWPPPWCPGRFPTAGRRSRRRQGSEPPRAAPRPGNSRSSPPARPVGCRGEAPDSRRPTWRGSIRSGLPTGRYRAVRGQGRGSPSPGECERPTMQKAGRARRTRRPRRERRWPARAL